MYTHQSDPDEKPVFRIHVPILALSIHHFPTRITPRSKLLFIGDSITDCERTKPAGEGLFGALGKGYVSLIDALIDALLVAGDPAANIRIANQGTGSNTARDLKARWDQDVLAQQPDWLAVMIGINDV